MEFFLNRTELSLNSGNSGNMKITEAWIGLNLKILFLHVSCWYCSSILVSHTRGGFMADFSPFTVMTNIFVTEFSETFGKNSNDRLYSCQFTTSELYKCHAVETKRHRIPHWQQGLLVESRRRCKRIFENSSNAINIVTTKWQIQDFPKVGAPTP